MTQEQDAQETASPLLEASSDSLNELFSRDPFGLARPDRDRIVEELRRMRAKWQGEEAAGAKKASAPRGVPKAKGKLTEDQADDLLKDLGL